VNHHDCEVVTELGDSLVLDSASLDSPALDVVDLPLLPDVLDALCTLDVERAFDEADSAGSCPEASWT
jgi:hypothetical protein